MRFAVVGALFAFVALSPACEQVPDCYAVPSLVLERIDHCVFQGAYGTCAPRTQTPPGCTTTVCCAFPSDPGTLYGAQCECPSDMRACTADEAQDFEHSKTRLCNGDGGATDAESDAPGDGDAAD